MQLGTLGTQKLACVLAAGLFGTAHAKSVAGA